MKDDRLVNRLALKLGMRLKKTYFNSFKKSSLFKDNSISCISTFNWNALHEDFRKTNPLLCTLLEPCVDHSNRLSNRNPDKHVVISIIAAIIWKALKLLNEIQQNFDMTTKVPLESSYHTFRSMSTDLNKVIQQLHTTKVFELIPNRQHARLPKFKGSIVNDVNKSELKEWMTNQITKIICYSV